MEDHNIKLGKYLQEASWLSCPNCAEGGFLMIEKATTTHTDDIGYSTTITEIYCKNCKDRWDLIMKAQAGKILIWME